LEDILAFFVTIGSPALAVYSLQITRLNTRWLSKAFSDVNFPNSKIIPTAISAFQHVPIQISSHPTLLPSLIVLPQNDGYWNILLKGAKKIRRWSIPLIMNFVWVVIATLLTIIDSFNSAPPGGFGYSTVAIWIFFLPLIMGWWSEPEPSRLKDCLEVANRAAWVATKQGDRPVLAESVAGHNTPPIELVNAHDVASARKDELKTTPIFNYSRVFTWSQNAERVLALVKNAASNAEQKIAVGSLGNGGDSVWVKGEQGNVANENRVGTSVQVAQYCAVAFPPLEPDTLDVLSPGTSNTVVQSPQFYEPHPDPSIWPTDVWKRVALATTLALGLQWGTTGGAILIHYWEYPVGLGCRTLTFLLYAAASTLSFFLFLASSILAHASRPPPGRPHSRLRSRSLFNGAVLCRRLGKVVATISAIGILTAYFFQAAGAFDTCFCTSTTFDKGRVGTFFTTNYSFKSTVSGFWVGGLATASSTALLFGFSIYVDKPPHL
jgi:hypothetical protein